MFELKLSVFQGPLDLLLQLIEKEELDITAVSLAQVTDQYWVHLRSAEELDAEALAEFIAVGARLLYIKSRVLLPELRPRQRVDEEKDVGGALAQMVVEYKRFREAAETFRDLEEQGRHAYPRLAPPSKDFLLPPGLKGVTLEGLLNIFEEALNRQPAEPEQEEGAIEREAVTVEDKMAGVMAAVAGGSGRVSFRALVEACTSRIEVIVVFLAALELIKAGQLVARQRGRFRDIILAATEAAASVSP
ncbi:MAG: segregation/condensation protein A [Dehalococcoidia bacterium]|nr:segregation/condensation protein A [Dehalococcoidia bacterium]